MGDVHALDLSTLVYPGFSDRVAVLPASDEAARWIRTPFWSSVRVVEAFAASAT